MPSPARPTRRGFAIRSLAPTRESRSSPTRGLLARLRRRSTRASAVALDARSWLSSCAPCARRIARRDRACARIRAFLLFARDAASAASRASASRRSASSRAASSAAPARGRRDFGFRLALQPLHLALPRAPRGSPGAWPRVHSLPDRWDRISGGRETSPPCALRAFGGGGLTVQKLLLFKNDIASWNWFGCARSCHKWRRKRQRICRIAAMRRQFEFSLAASSTPLRRGNA